MKKNEKCENNMKCKIGKEKLQLCTKCLKIKHFRNVFHRNFMTAYILDITSMHTVYKGNKHGMASELQIQLN